MPYVQRINGKIVGESPHFNSGYGEEWVAEDHPELVAFRNRPSRVGVVSAFQARAALHLAGHLTAAEAFVAESNDPIIQMAWEYAVEFQRLSPTILAAQQALGMTDEEMDDLFTLAATINA
jgi:hypothetical protein